MDVYIFDNNLSKIGVVDNYESLIWTERYDEVGDFELRIRASTTSRNLFYEGLKLGIRDSTRVMVVESILDEISDDGGSYLTVTGPSYEEILRSRVISVGPDYEYFGPKYINYAKNPGFLVMADQIEYVPAESGPSTDLNLVSVPEAHSRSGIEIVSTDSSDVSYYYAGKEVPLKDWYGKRIIVQAKAYVPNAWAGSNGSHPPMSICLDMVNLEEETETLAYDYIQAPTSAGHHEVEFAVDIPMDDSYDHFNLRLIGGSSVGSTITWYDMVITRSVEESPLGYFDGDYSPHVDYEASWDGDIGGSTSSITHHGGLPIFKTPKKKPNEIIEWVVDEFVVHGGVHPNDGVDKIEFSNIYPEDDLPYPEGEEDYEIQPVSVEDFVYEVAKDNRMGIRMVRCSVCKSMKFMAYTGSDRSVKVIFSHDFENLSEPTTYKTTQEFRNVAYVYSPIGVRIVYGQGVSSDISGSQRRVLLVEASDLDEPTVNWEDQMELRGEEALNRVQSTLYVDGKVPPEANFKYDRDYYLGDLVSLVGPDGAVDKMRVVEYIFISDPEGVRSYPTLRAEEEVSGGTWYSAEWDIEWIQVPDTSEYEWGTID